VITPFGQGLLITEAPPTTTEQRVCAATSWSPTIQDAIEAEKILAPKLYARLGAFHPDQLREIRLAKRHYLGVRIKGHDTLLVVGFRPEGHHVLSGLWEKPLLVTAPAGDCGFQLANVLFMAWLSPTSSPMSVERLWPEGKASEYSALAEFRLDRGLLRSSLRSVRWRLLLRSYSCEPPNYEIKENTSWRYTEAVYFTCPIRNPDGGLPREGLSVYATATLVRSHDSWERSGESVRTSWCLLR